MDAVSPNLWTGTFRREQLVELLDGRGPRPVRDDEARLSRHLCGHDLLGVWVADDESSLSPLPQMLVGEPELLKDLLAWSASYLRALGPLSGLTRIVTVAQFRSILDRHPPQASWKIAGGAVGLIISEVMALSNGIGIEAAAAATPSSTLSFAILRAWSLGLPNAAINEIAEGYARASGEAQRPDIEYIRRAAAEMAASLMGSEESTLKGRKISERYRRWMKDLRLGVNIYDIASDILIGSPDLLSKDEVSHLADMTAERRVQFFDRLSPSLAHAGSADDRLDSAFSLAFAAFICRPGLEQQASLLTEYAQHLPEAWLCLGALQAFTPMADVLAIGSGAGWRIARELFRPEDLWAPPRADAALVEVEILSDGKSQLLRRVMSKPRVNIEIYPMISIAVRGAPSIPEKRGNNERKPISEKSDNSISEIKKLEGVEARLMDALRILGDIRRGEETFVDRAPRRRR